MVLFIARGNGSLKGQVCQTNFRPTPPSLENRTFNHFNAGKFNQEMIDYWKLGSIKLHIIVVGIYIAGFFVLEISLQIFSSLNVSESLYPNRPYLRELSTISLVVRAIWSIKVWLILHLLWIRGWHQLILNFSSSPDYLRSNVMDKVMAIAEGTTLILNIVYGEIEKPSYFADIGYVSIRTH